MNIAIAYLVKPLFLIALFGAARLLAMVLWRVWPDGKAKRYWFRDTGPL